MSINKMALAIYNRTKQANLAALQAVASGSSALLPRMAISGIAARKGKIGLQTLGAAEVGNMLLKAEQAKRNMLIDAHAKMQKAIKLTTDGKPIPANLNTQSLAEINNIKLHDIILDKQLRQLGEESVLASPVSAAKTLLGIN
jgi:hypothetical protein